MLVFCASSTVSIYILLNTRKCGAMDFRGCFDWLIKPRFNSFSGSCGEDEAFTFKDLALRGVVVLVTTIWLSVFPLYVFIIYMHERNFFSYDFFTQGVFGLHIFVATTALMLLLTSLIFYGFVLSARVSITERVQKGKISWSNWILTWILFLFSAFMHYAIFHFSLAANRPEAMAWLMVTSFFICMFLLCFVGNGVKKNLKNWMAPAAFIIASMYFPFMLRGETANAVSLGMQIFRIGGGVHASITEMNGSDDSIEGELLLLAPNNAYMNNLDGDLIVVPLSERTKITINR